MVDVAFVLVRQAAYPDPNRVIASARRGGIELRLVPESIDMPSFETTDGETMIVALMPGPHPDAAQLPTGITSPAADDVASAGAHFIVTALRLTGSPRERDTRMAILAASVIENVDAVGAMLGHGVVFHKAQLFAELAMVAATEHELLPAEVAVDITVGQDSTTRMSFLSHNMERYGREDIYLTCPINGTGALPFLLSLVRWTLNDPNVALPTGDTVGRSEDEKIVVHRGPNPTGRGNDVIQLDLPD